MLSHSGGPAPEDEPYLVASASSDGVIRVWDVRMAYRGRPDPLAEAKTKSRLTCLAGSSFRSEYRICTVFPGLYDKLQLVIVFYYHVNEG